MTAVDLGGVTLNTRLDGPEGAPWMILSHSLGATLSMWDPQIDVLTTRYRVLRYDTRGHGQSAVPPGPYSLDDLVGDVVALMDRMKIEQASWMGLSMGAMTGMGLALRHGDRFQRMVLADGRADAPEGFCTMWDQRTALIRDGGTEAIADGTMDSWLTADFRNANPDVVAQMRAMVVDTPDAGYIACALALKELDYLRHLGNVSVPVLYIGGDQDMGAAPEVMQAMADATPGARYVSVENAAHVANVNRPAAFNAAISAFLGL